MSVARRVLDTALVVGTSSAQLAHSGGVPIVGAAAFLLGEISRLCDQVRFHKTQCRILIHRVQIIIDALQDGTSGLTGSRLQEAANTLEMMLRPIHDKMIEWARWGLLRSIWNISEVSNGIMCAAGNINTYQEQFHIQAQMITIAKLDESQQIQQCDSAEIRAALQNIMNDQTQLKDLLQMRLAGESAAKEVMRATQSELHEHDRGSPTYTEFESYVHNLYNTVGVLPSVHNLSHEIVKTEGPIAGGPYSEVSLGLWLGKVQVALKSLREVKISHPQANKKFEREISIWHTLEHPNILRFLGIADNLGPYLCVVSPWQSNGNALEYTKNHPDVDRIQLLIGAARGVEYLHTRDMPVVHGNLKCANILVSEKGEAVISDFGLSRVVEDITEVPAHITLTSTGGNRWCAPELMESSANISPNLTTDVYAFSMCILECLTSNKPFENLKRDPHVVVAVTNKKRPSRPKEDVWNRWFNDKLWDLLERCWAHEPSCRPTMSEVSVELSVIGQERAISPEAQSLL